MDPDFAVTCPLVRRRRPLIQFLYIGPYLCSTLDFDPLGDWDVLDKRQVHIPKTRPGKFVSREVCRAWAGCRQRRVRIREAERSGVPPLLAKARIERMADRCVRIAD